MTSEQRLLEDLGRRLRQAREEAGQALAAVARAAGLSRRHLTEIEAGNVLRRLPSLPTEPEILAAGTRVHHQMAGGGGYGDPLTRAPERVAEDLADGLVTEAHARAVYGVVFSDPKMAEIDRPSTDDLRAQMRAAQQT